MSETPKSRKLHEAAPGGLSRCTAVTLQAILSYFRKNPLKMHEVPAFNTGVLEIIRDRGLTLVPDLKAVGHNVQSFVNTHRRGVYYVGTPGHAMALVNGVLYDAEQKGADSRPVRFAFLVSQI